MVYILIFYFFFFASHIHIHSYAMCTGEETARKEIIIRYNLYFLPAPWGILLCDHSMFQHISMFFFPFFTMPKLFCVQI